MRRLSAAKATPERRSPVIVDACLLSASSNVSSNRSGRNWMRSLLVATAGTYPRKVHFHRRVDRLLPDARPHLVRRKERGIGNFVSFGSSRHISGRQRRQRRRPADLFVLGSISQHRQGDRSPACSAWTSSTRKCFRASRKRRHGLGPTAGRPRHPCIAGRGSVPGKPWPDPAAGRFDGICGLRYSPASSAQPQPAGHSQPSPAGRRDRPDSV